ncbi:MAG: peptidoglycan -binding protein [Methylococcus sp.]|nr:peptidoglycan -binding protein [Methylococcus sp.]
MSASFARRRRTLDIWPGFVDALSSLILVMVFVLLLFAIGQFVLAETLSGKSRALDLLNGQIAELAKTLALTQDDKRELDSRVKELAASLSSAVSERDAFKAQADSSRAEAVKLGADVLALAELKKQLEAQVANLVGQLDLSKKDLVAANEVNARSVAQTELLNRQLAALREQLEQVSAALNLANASIKAKDARIADLGKELNVALAAKVNQLERYRSEFFGRLSEALGNRSDIRVVGDRFVLPTDILFDSGSADLGPAAQAQLERLSESVREVAGKIPPAIDWVLRIDGHTDKRPIQTDRFPSNWELSTARAVAILKYLVMRGVSPQRLSANGFGEFQPVDALDTTEGYAKNRRIEIQLTNR